jgi:bifunctional UDP-N-acetylglucosamine pyrophosphorylase/glucosamine-1-phosphate N-acetyltransferase
MKTAAVILAAGKGTRMKSKLAKVLHPLLGRSVLWHVLQVVREAGVDEIVVVVGHDAEQVRAAFADKSVTFVEQTEQLGTAHAMMQAQSVLEGRADQVLVLYGDMPLWQAGTLQTMIAMQVQNQGPLSMATIVADDPRGFGRVIRGEDGSVSAIVEEAQCTPQQLAVNELNVGLYCFDADWLWENLSTIQLSPKGEYYLTDLPEIAVHNGKQVAALVLEDESEAIGINTRVHLAEAEAVLRVRVNQALMLSGVTIIDPQCTYIEPGVQIGQDTVIHPNTFLRGDTVIGEDCQIGPNSLITDCRIGNGCVILASVLDQAKCENFVHIGPFGRLRPGAHLADHVDMGNFGEVKNSYLAEGVKMGHFSYIGDSQVGSHVNIGCGTVTCNYDGKKKNKTIIGDHTFIGSGSMLVAPLEIGSHSYTGAGSVVTHDVADDTVVVGVPARVLRKGKSE